MRNPISYLICNPNSYPVRNSISYLTSNPISYLTKRNVISISGMEKPLEIKKRVVYPSDNDSHFREFRQKGA
jgi:hypothetical protein